MCIMCGGCMATSKGHDVLSCCHAVCGQPLAIRFGTIPAIERVLFKSSLTDANPDHRQFNKKRVFIYQVLHSTRWGCIAWQLEPVRNGGLKYFMLKRAMHGQPLPWEVLHISALDDCKAAKLKALPPAAQIDTAQGRPPPGGIVFSLDGPIEKLTVFAARSAFVPLTVPFMEELMALLCVPDAGQVPRREKDVAECLVNHVLGPSLPAADLQAILQHRTYRKSAAADHLESELLKGDNLEAMQGVLDEDYAATAEAIKSKMPAGGALSSSTSGVAASSGSSGGAAAPAAAAREKLSFKGTLTPAWAKEQLPRVQGVNIHLGTLRHFRWSVRYDQKPEPPSSVAIQVRPVVTPCFSK